MPLLDERQILQRVLNSTEDRIKVDINATVTAGAVEVAIDQTTDSIKVGDGTDIMQVNPDGSINVVGTIAVPSDVNIHDGAGNSLTSQVSGGQRALDVGIAVSGTQVDPRQIRILTSSDVVTVVQPTGTNLHVAVDNFPATQPVSGTVTANAGTNLNTSALALSATQTDRTQKTQLTDGTRDGTIKAASIAAAADDTSLVVGLSPNSPLPTGTNTIGAVVGNVASGGPDSGNPVKISGVYNTTIPTPTAGNRQDLQVDSAGSLYINTQGRKRTYSAASTFISVVTPTDVFTITGSSTKTIRITKITVGGSNTGASNILVQIARRSTANTGGTSTTLTNVPSDSQAAAATATVRSYTVNPTLGTLVGVARAQNVFMPVFASANAAPTAIFDFSTNSTEPQVLRGTSEVLSVNLNGAVIGGTTTLVISIEWTEE